MKGFAGFPAGKQPNVPLPELFFTELLPEVDHLGELKLTLHIFWLLARCIGKKGGKPCVSYEELTADRRLLDGLASPGLSPEEALRDALERAVARGTLLRVTQAPGAAALASAGGSDWYFANTEKGRQAVNDLLAGKWTPGEPGKPLLLQAHRPNIFVLYEQNIGPLTPLLAEQLQDAEKSYPALWIEDAFKEAAELNKRSWRYVQRILERWTTEGKGDETARRGDDRKDRRRFIEGEYADYIEH
ncbi:MAG: DnaD domain protein [Anaerolineae bacterium]|nr:DnaD domain protein [Anaerolineae bacterium]